jgi:hypothetical protein
MFLFIYGAGAEPSPTLLWSFSGLLYQTWMVADDYYSWAIGGMNDWHRKMKYSEKNLLRAAFSTTDLTLLDQGSNLGLRGGKPATNFLVSKLLSAIRSESNCIQKMWSCIITFKVL